MCLRSNNKPSSNLVISVERVEEVLQSGWFNGADLYQLLHLLELKVADPDVADVTSTMQLFHRFPSVLPSSWLFLALKTIKTNNIEKRESRKKKKCEFVCASNGLTNDSLEKSVLDIPDASCTSLTSTQVFSASVMLVRCWQRSKS